MCCRTKRFVVNFLRLRDKACQLFKPYIQGAMNMRMLEDQKNEGTRSTNEIFGVISFRRVCSQLNYRN